VSFVASGVSVHSVHVCIYKHIYRVAAVSHKGAAIQKMPVTPPVADHFLKSLLYSLALNKVIINDRTTH